MRAVRRQQRPGRSDAPVAATPALLAAARAIWDRGRTHSTTFDELSDNQRADLIADAAAVVESLADAVDPATRWLAGIDEVLGLTEQGLSRKFD